MSTGNIVVSQDAPAKNNLWIQPKGTARFWNGSIWKTISGGGGGDITLVDLMGSSAIGTQYSPLYWTGSVFSPITYTLSSTVNSGTANRLAYYTSSGIDDASTTYVSNTKLAINSTSEPSYNFYVNGTSCFTDNLYINNAKGIRIGNNATSSVYQDVMRLDSSNAFIIGNGTSASGYTTYLDGKIVNVRYGTNHTSGIYLNASGNVGFGTTSPSCKIHAMISTTSENEIRTTNSNGSVSLLTSTNRGVYDRTTNTWLIATNGTNSWLSRGNVGIGTTTPSVKLSVSGNIYASGGVTALASVSSDKRLKKNIKPFNAIEIVDKLQPVEFEWNSKAKKYSDTFKDGKNYGLIAQDSDGIIDDLVFDLPDGKRYKGVRYEKLIPILLQAIKELKEEVEKLKNKKT